MHIKLIWDFRGPDARLTAEHHRVHLEDYHKSEGLEPGITGTHDLSPNHSMAFLVVTREQMPGVRDRLKPHRGEVYEMP